MVKSVTEDNERNSKLQQETQKKQDQQTSEKQKAYKEALLQNQIFNKTYGQYSNITGKFEDQPKETQTPVTKMKCQFSSASPIAEKFIPGKFRIPENNPKGQKEAEEEDRKKATEGTRSLEGGRLRNGGIPPTTKATTKADVQARNDHRTTTESKKPNGPGSATNTNQQTEGEGLAQKCQATQLVFNSQSEEAVQGREYQQIRGTGNTAK